MTISNETEQEIYTNVEINLSKCYGKNQWTDWNSVDDPAINNGSDFETLSDHKRFFG